MDTRFRRVFLVNLVELSILRELIEIVVDTTTFEAG
jgi:hypothetical protein